MPDPHSSPWAARNTQAWVDTGVPRPQAITDLMGGVPPVRSDRHSEAERHSVVLGISDPMLARHLHHYVQDHPRFRLVGTAANTIQTLHAVRETTPMIVVMSDVAEGMSGRSALGEIAEHSPWTCVILLSGGDPTEIPNAPNVAWTVSEHDVLGVHDVLAQMAAFFDEPRAHALERRYAPDRRTVQDWSKVFAERRDSPRRRRP